jgi:hypothetical protein
MDFITQQRLVKYLEAKKYVEDEREALTQELQGGVKVQPGPISAKLSVSTQKSVKWKKEFMDRLGEEAVEEVQSNAEEIEVTKLMVSAKKAEIPTKARKKKSKGESNDPDEGESLLSRAGGIW